MKLIGPPATLHLQAAQGWLELGNHIEADAELDNITPELRAHPDVLKVRWQIYATAKQWEAALEIAAAIIQMAPDDPVGWVDRSCVLHQLKRTAEARDNLLRVVDSFPVIAGCDDLIVSLVGLVVLLSTFWIWLRRTNFHNRFCEAFLK